MDNEEKIRVIEKRIGIFDRAIMQLNKDLDYVTAYRNGEHDDAYRAHILLMQDAKEKLGNELQILKQTI